MPSGGKGGWARLTGKGGLSRVSLLEGGVTVAEPGNKSMLSSRVFTALWIAAGVALMPVGARASLGGGVDTIAADGVHMAMRSHAVAARGTAMLHTLTLANGGTIKEYVNAAGTVYAVSWKGPGKPDLHQVLGAYFAAFQADNARRRRPGIRMAPFVDRGDVKIVTGGHPGGFWGVAWLPGIVPAGFDPHAL